MGLRRRRTSARAPICRRRPVLATEIVPRYFTERLAENAGRLAAVSDVGRRAPPTARMLEKQLAGVDDRPPQTPGSARPGVRIYAAPVGRGGLDAGSLRGFAD